MSQEINCTLGAFHAGMCNGIPQPTCPALVSAANYPHPPDDLTPDERLLVGLGPSDE